MTSLHKLVGNSGKELVYCIYLFGSKQNQNFQNKRQLIVLAREYQLKVQSSD